MTIIDLHPARKESLMREKSIEQKLTLMVKKRGGICPKFVSPGFDGMPDRIVLLPDGHMGFVEVKAPGKKPRPLQIARHKLLIKGKEHHFCSRQCLADFSSKAKNPGNYAALKDYSKMSQHLSDMNRERNPHRMTAETRSKIRDSRLNTGAGTYYVKFYGKHEHRYVAETMLGRKLRPGEIVHHCDGNKRNNTPNNIVVFPSQSAHAKHHAELRWFINEISKMEGGYAK